MTDEHVIREALGAQLVAAFLCARSNSELGRREDDFKRDPSIRLAVQNRIRPLDTFGA